MRVHKTHQCKSQRTTNLAKDSFLPKLLYEKKSDSKTGIPYQPSRISPAIHARGQTDIETVDLQQYLRVDPMMCSPAVSSCYIVSNVVSRSSYHIKLGTTKEKGTKCACCIACEGWLNQANRSERRQLGICSGSMVSHNGVASGD
jgi:hypothetical protein